MPEKGKKADLMFVQHRVAALKADEKIVTVMPPGVLFRGGEEKEARKRFIERGWLDAVMAPQTIIDDIVVHELGHLLHLDHTDAFWNEVDQVLPNDLERKAWLRIHGASLDLSYEPIVLIENDRVDQRDEDGHDKATIIDNRLARLFRESSFVGMAVSAPEERPSFS